MMTCYDRCLSIDKLTASLSSLRTNAHGYNSKLLAIMKVSLFLVSSRFPIEDGLTKPFLYMLLVQLMLE